MKAAAAHPPRKPRFPIWIGILSLGLTVLFWGPLWLGDGLIGGDLYTYSLPQKVFLADCLAEGYLPLWNPLVGLGYPVLAESQTGVFYPLHWVTYGLLDVETAANAVLLAHYVLAFVAMAWCARWMGLGTAGMSLAAVVYVYGWFPARVSLDWAILGGLYLPCALGCLEAFWQTRHWKYALGLSVAIALQLLGGHFHLAYLTWLLILGYGLWRYGQARMAPDSAPTLVADPKTSPPSAVSPTESQLSRQRFTVAVLCLACLGGVGLASIQLLPTWELKARSQRTSKGKDFDPAYGHLPPLYMSQVALPWLWYSADIDLDTAINRLTALSVPAATNRVEAHLYFGQIPLYLALWQFFSTWRRTGQRGATLFWSGAILVSLIYASGWPGYLCPWLPGVNFFRGSGRGGLIATFAVALLAGAALDRLGRQLSGNWSSRLSLGLILFTIVDLWWVPSGISYTVIVSQPPIRRRDESPVRRLLLPLGDSVRLYAPGANLPTLTGISAVPVYLGLGPDEYFSGSLQVPTTDPEGFHTFSQERLDWLRNVGVTHILAFERLEPMGWPVELIWAGIDPLLNAAWARFQDPIFLYRLQGSSGRVIWNEADPGATAEVTRRSAQQFEVQASSMSGGVLVVRELAYPGWVVSVDGKPATPLKADAPFCGVELPPGEHRVIWSYRSAAVYWGWIGSGLALFGIGVGTLALVRRSDP